jgi:hypothetical protein
MKILGSHFNNPLFFDSSRDLYTTSWLGEIRAHDQRIKRSRNSSFSYISIGLAVGQSDCAIECAIEVGY